MNNTHPGHRHGIAIGLPIEVKEAMLAETMLEITTLSQDFATSFVEHHGDDRWEKLQGILDDIDELKRKAQRLVTDLKLQPHLHGNVLLGLGQASDRQVDFVDLIHSGGTPYPWLDAHQRTEFPEEYGHWSIPELPSAGDSDRKENSHTTKTYESDLIESRMTGVGVDTDLAYPDLGLAVRGGEYGQDDLGSR